MKLTATPSELTELLKVVQQFMAGHRDYSVLDRLLLMTEGARLGALLLPLLLEPQVETDEQKAVIRQTSLALDSYAASLYNEVMLDQCDRLNNKSGKTEESEETEPKVDPQIPEWGDLGDDKVGTNVEVVNDGCVDASINKDHELLTAQSSCCEHTELPCAVLTGLTVNMPEDKPQSINIDTKDDDTEGEDGEETEGEDDEGEDDEETEGEGEGNTDAEGNTEGEGNTDAEGDTDDDDEDTEGEGGDVQYYVGE